MIKTTKSMLKIGENAEAICLMSWINKVGIKLYPELSLFHHIPNGGKRGIRCAINLKRTGVIAGIPDYFLPVSRRTYHGLYIELKRRDRSSTSLAQRIILRQLMLQGYKTDVAKGFEEARDILLDYMSDDCAS